MLGIMKKMVGFGMLNIMNKCYGSVCSVSWKNAIILCARYYEQMLWFCMLGIMNKCYGSVCSILWTNVMVRMLGIMKKW